MSESSSIGDPPSDSVVIVLSKSGRAQSRTENDLIRIKPLSVVPAQAGTHMWTAPASQGRCSADDGSGRLRSYVRPLHAAWIAAGPDGLRGSGPEQGSDVYASLGSTGCPGPRTDRSPSCCGPCKRQRAVVTGSSRLRSAVQFAAHQHGPDGAGHLVGQRDRRELSRLARQQLQKPGRVVAARLFGFAASLDLLDDGSGTEHQQPA